MEKGVYASKEHMVRSGRRILGAAALPVAGLVFTRVVIHAAAF